MRIALIHALRHSPPPIEAAFREIWPEATLMNVLDDSLSADLARDGTLTPAMTQRFLTIGRYCAGTGARGVLFTCSAFGPCIEAVQQDLSPIPVLKPNSAAIEEVLTHGSRIGLLASFPATLTSMPPEFPAGVEVVPCLAKGALAALDAGEMDRHDDLVAEAAKRLAGCDAILLGQFSLARAARKVAATTGLPVVTTPGSAVRRLKALLAA